MSAIGDYVHLTAKGYLENGIKRRKGSNPSAEIMSIRAKMRAKATTIKVNKQQIQKLQDDYNKYHATLAFSNDKNIERIRQSIITSLINKYGENLDEEVKQSIEFLFGSGDITAIPTTIQDPTVKLKKTANIDDAKWSFVGTVEKRIAHAYSQLENIQNIETKTILTSKIQEIENSLNEVIKQSASTAAEKNIRGFALGRGENKFKATDQVIPNKDAQELISQLNTALALFKIPNIANWLGTFEEIIAEYCALKIAGESNEAIANLFEDLILSNNKISTQGETSIKTDFDLKQLISTNSKLLKDIKTLEKSSIIKTKGGKATLSLTSSTTSKADVYFTIETDREVGASVKNYNLSIPNFDIHLVNQSPLLYFLMGMKNNAAATHYLNIFADHEDDDLSLAFANLKQVAAEGLTYQLLYSALSGRGVGRTGGFADLFILNDNSAKPGASAKFYDVGTLISAIITYNKIENVNIKIDNKTLMDFRIANPEVYISNTNSKTMGEAIQMRLTALMHDVHKKKVSVALKKSIFSDSAVKSL